jgi:hydrogenase expression/formation protein HypE
MENRIVLNHGGGGLLTRKLIQGLFADRFGLTDPLTDSAVIAHEGEHYAFTTDSYVVDPIFFPGGDIGKLSVCGTVNDLAVAGAVPGFLSASFIIEEGLPLRDLEQIVESMALASAEAGTKIITGDTKVVERGKCDKIYINTSGTGILKKDHLHIGIAAGVEPGDKLIINGPLGNHAVSVMGARKQLNFSAPVISDCAPLNRMIQEVLAKTYGVKFMRDLTRGGLAGVLNELADICGRSIIVNESMIPVDEPVRAVCEMYGFDPMYLANEGKVLFVCSPAESEKIVRILSGNCYGKQSAIIGEIAEKQRSMVIMNTSTGGSRIIDMPSGGILPRIC